MTVIFRAPSRAWLCFAIRENITGLAPVIWNSIIAIAAEQAFSGVVGHAHGA